jgi:hypothetical protein
MSGPREHPKPRPAPPPVDSEHHWRRQVRATVEEAEQKKKAA